MAHAHRIRVLGALLVLAAGACSDDEVPTPAAASPTTFPAPTGAATPVTTPPVTTAPSAAPTDADASPPPVTEEAGGCGGPAPASGAIDITEEDLLRTAILHVPSGYDPATPTPLVLNFHGYTSSGGAQERVSGFSAAADTFGFLVVYPDGAGAPRAWNSGTRLGAGGADDVRFTLALIDHLAAIACVDRSRVFATGYSNGGGMSDRLACDEAGSFAAIATVAGLYATLPCEPTRPVPVVAFHGVDDGVVPYEGGELGAIAVEMWAANWAVRNGCTTGPVTDPPVGRVVRLVWEGCAAPVELYRVEDGGHTWPGAAPVPFLGHTNTDISATDIAWAFFAAADPVG